MQWYLETQITPLRKKFGNYRNGTIDFKKATSYSYTEKVTTRSGVVSTYKSRLESALKNLLESQLVVQTAIETNGGVPNKTFLKKLKDEILNSVSSPLSTAQSMMQQKDAEGEYIYNSVTVTGTWNIDITIVTQRQYRQDEIVQPQYVTNVYKFNSSYSVRG